MEGETIDSFNEKATVEHALMRGDTMEENYILSTTISHQPTFHVD